MATDNGQAAPRFTSRQKMIAVAVIVVLLILVWQIIGLFGSSSSTEEPLLSPTPQANLKAGAPRPGATGNNTQGVAHNTAGTTPVGMPPNVTGAMNAPTGAMNAPMQQQVSMQPIKAIVPTDQTLIAAQQEQQKQYVDTINQLQLLKLQKDIDETKRSIAAARLATATAEKSISDLFAKPAPPPPGSASDYANKLGGAGNETPTSPPPLATPSIQYIVISVSMQLGHWTAVLGTGGKLYNVSVGDILPADGSEVVAIGKYGVVLKKDNTKRRISLVSSI